jgi:hypothetical protein
MRIAGERMANNTPGDNGQIVYDEQGKIVREAFGRRLTKLETELCDALDRANGWGDVITVERLPRTMGHE